MTDDAPSPVPSSSALDWRAIALGAGATLAVGMLAPYLLVQVWPRSTGEEIGWFWLVWLFPLLGLLADALGGALAGLLARRRGAVHGALASVLAFAGGMVISVARMVSGGAGEMLLSPLYWLKVIGWSALGIGVAALAGAIAARAAASAPSE
jgi:hypothetical protein